MGETQAKMLSVASFLKQLGTLQAYLMKFSSDRHEFYIELDSVRMCDRLWE